MACLKESSIINSLYGERWVMNVVPILLRLTFLNSDGDHYASYIDRISGGESLLTSMLEYDGSGLFRYATKFAIPGNQKLMELIPPIITKSVAL